MLFRQSVNSKRSAGYVRVVTRNKFVDRLKARLRHHEKETLPWDDETARAFGSPDGDVAELTFDGVRVQRPDSFKSVEALARKPCAVTSSLA